MVGLQGFWLNLDRQNELLDAESFERIGTFIHYRRVAEFEGDVAGILSRIEAGEWGAWQVWIALDRASQSSASIVHLMKMISIFRIRFSGWFGRPAEWSYCSSACFLHGC